MNRWTLVLLLALAGAACNAPAPPPPDTAADEAALRALIEQTAAFNNAADSAGWVGLFEEDAVYMPPGSPEVTTREGIREAAAAFRNLDSDITITPAEIVVSGDWAFARSHVGGTVTVRESGDEIPIDVKQLVVYHRQPDGAWKIARLIGNWNHPR